MTLQDAIDRCKAEKEIFPDIIDSSAGLYENPVLNVVGIPSWNRNNPSKNRSAVLEISTFRGISSDATHYYGTIIVDGVYQATLGNIEKPRNLSFKEEHENPLLNYRYVFIIKRPLTKREIEADKDRWLAYDEGDLTQCYETTQELINDAKEIFKLRFSGTWDFYVQYPRGQKEKI